jgi:hypothetical protein
MEFESVKPYSREFSGNLMGYFREHSDGSPDNFFYGSSHFFEIRDGGLLLPNWSVVRIGNSFTPDLCYFVNDDFLLESSDPGEFNMSAIGGDKGVYSPSELLGEKFWSIGGLNLEKLFEGE